LKYRNAFFIYRCYETVFAISSLFSLTTPYEWLCGGADPAFGPLSTCDGLTDVWVAQNNGVMDGATHGPDDNPRRLDYVFMTHELVDNVNSIWVDYDAGGSDHKPVVLELNLWNARFTPGPGPT